MKASARHRLRLHKDAKADLVVLSTAPIPGHGADDRKSKYNTLNETVIASLKRAKASK